MPWKRCKVCRRYMVTAAKAHKQTLRDGVVRAAKAVDDIAELEGQSPKNFEQALGALQSPQAKRNSSRAERRTKQATALVEYAKKASDVATCVEAATKAKRFYKAHRPTPPRSIVP